MTASEVVRRLERMGNRAAIADQARFGIDASDPFGVSVGDLKKLAKEIGRDHGLATELWAVERYEARMLVAFVGEPDRLTIQRMNAWAGDFDNWAIVDTICFHLFDRSRHAWSRVPIWARSRSLYRKRAAFATVWGLAVHDKEAGDDRFVDLFPVFDAAADDDRPHVKKAVDMALRAIGKRNRAMNRAALTLADELAADEDPTRSWIGRHVAKELRSAKVQAKLT